MFFQNDDPESSEIIKDEPESDLASLLTLNQISDLHPNMNSDILLDTIQLPTELEISLLPSRSRGRYEKIMKDLSNFIELGEQEFGEADDSGEIIAPEELDHYSLIHEDERRDYPYHIHSPRQKTDPLTQGQPSTSDDTFEPTNVLHEYEGVQNADDVRLFLTRILHKFYYDTGLLNEKAEETEWDYAE